MASEAAVLEMKAMEEMFTTDQKFVLTIQPSILKDAVKKIAASVNSKSIIPIEQGIFFKVEKEKITLRAMNGHHAAELTITDLGKFDTTGEGGLVFDGKQFADLVTRINTEKDITIEFDKKTAIFKFKGTKATMQGLHLDEFPNFPAVNESFSFKLPAGYLAHLYKQVLYACSTDQIRPVLTGVHHVSEGNVLKLVATNGQILAQVKDEREENLPPFSLTVPATTINEVLKFLADSIQVTLACSASHFIYRTENGCIYARIFQDQYPDTDRVIPNEYNTKLVLPVKELVEAIKIATIYKDQDSKTELILKVKPSLNQLRIMSVSEYGQFKADLIPESSYGDEMTVVMDASYLQGALQHYNADDMIEFRFIDYSRPITIMLKDGKEGNLDLIMPVKSKHSSDKADIEDFNPDTYID